MLSPLVPASICFLCILTQVLLFTFQIRRRISPHFFDELFDVDVMIWQMTLYTLRTLGVEKPLGTSLIIRILRILNIDMQKNVTR